ncbi:hypothetical protein [Mycobacterium sp. OTB74]|jgi:hypothetical protein|uniref:hypothetical protein n=1 Tax=Mycobacterium sp. OTB74 TaxID=1853452 RepID=UPI0024768AC5|nr:hypothetical protein [Mycobacterium sp. OTB74]MDH6244366.1 hypothetical protein [Mycobacterium sp. OTB74]
MSWSEILRKAAVGLGALAVPAAFTVAGAGQASADHGPGACVTGPFGYASACVNGPGWWGPHWDGWRPGWHGGDGDSQGGNWQGGDD